MIGKNISHYKILEKLGAGGMGVVYKAEDTKLDRYVALKFLPQHLSQAEEEKKRFIHEAKAASALDHPNIGTIYEIDETEDGQMFIAMACYEGESLKDKIDRGTLPIEEAIDIAIQIVQGLEKAHSKEIVHRDIKPANVLLTEDGQAKIVDFGLAKLVNRTMLTKEGTTLGTVAYMSPEQTQGTLVDHRTDIWALGVVLHEMLSGEHPFKGDYEQAVIYSIMNEEPPTLTELCPTASKKLTQLVRKTLQKDPDERYESTIELLSDLKLIRTESESASSKDKKKEKITPSVAVLPFVNIGGDPENEYFSDGLAEELINALTNVKGLQVAARTSSFRFRGKELDIRDIGKQLNVSTVLEGSVRKSGNRLRITAQLIKIEDGYHLWSERYDRDFDDVFAIQDEISLAIVEKLKFELLEEAKASLAERYTGNLEAYNLYLQGRHYFSKLSGDGYKKAIEYFKLALEKDPDYALAYAGLAESYSFLGLWGFTAPRESLPIAKEAAQKALALDNSLAEVRHSFGLVCTFNREWSVAKQEFNRAFELNPNYAFGHGCHAMYLRLSGSAEEGMAEIKLALELEPLSAPVNAAAAYFFYSMRLYDETIEQCRKTLELQPSFYAAHSYLALVYARKGMLEESILEWKTSLSARGASKVARAMQSAYERSGYKGALITAAQKISLAYQFVRIWNYLPLTKRRYVSPMVIAVLYTEAGEKDRAFKWLNKAYLNQEPQMTSLMVNPHWDSLRSDPRFDELLRKIGLEK
ncbi:MAG: protein kinase [Phycisphaerae bacterium]|nr:protein kinase [candidate division KSB1 bacterium]NIV01673.1 protein kinase [Phycisphaerae bacterium]NIR70879.1 protein kinase [candidate division KSB1 bacterium]NIS26071.1 protein kinase [candidate division KSB1 bacterium]NIT72871.1 protein kinase [candidate division KSB1 bacterium]